MAGSAQIQVRHLESCIAAGDIPGMARSVEALRQSWDSLDEATRADVLKLEAIFLSLVNAKAGVH